MEPRGMYYKYMFQKLHQWIQRASRMHRSDDSNLSLSRVTNAVILQFNAQFVRSSQCDCTCGFRAVVPKTGTQLRFEPGSTPQPLSGNCLGRCSDYRLWLSQGLLEIFGATSEAHASESYDIGPYKGI